MRRKGLCLITGCAEKRLDTMMTRGQWFATDSVGAHAKYSLEDAFRLHVMLVAMDQAGVDYETARYLMNGIGDLSMHPLNYNRNEGDMWIAAGVVKTKIDEIPVYKIHVAGRLQDIASKAHEKFDSASGEQLLSLISVNVSEAAHHVRQAALDIGLPEGDNYSMVWKNSQYPEWMQPDLADARVLMAKLDAGQ